MSIINLLSDIGEDADLLLRSDDWLEQERKSVASELNDKAKELEKLLIAQRLKRALQQKNIVPVQQVLRNTENQPTDIVLKFMKLPDAIGLLEGNVGDTLDELNTAAQMLTWSRDGYDIPTSRSISGNVKS